MVYAIKLLERKPRKKGFFWLIPKCSTNAIFNFGNAGVAFEVKVSNFSEKPRWVWGGEEKKRKKKSKKRKRKRKPKRKEAFEEWEEYEE